MREGVNTGLWAANPMTGPVDIKDHYRAAFGAPQAPVTAVKLDSAILGKLTDATKELAEVIRVDGDPSAVYRQLINLSYATTGNGYHLFEKGSLRI